MMKCEIQWCNEERTRGGMYCAPHQSECNHIGLNKMFNAEPLPAGNTLREFFGAFLTADQEKQENVAEGVDKRSD